jgi:hypothetical protein
VGDRDDDSLQSQKGVFLGFFVDYQEKGNKNEEWGKYCDS